MLSVDGELDWWGVEFVRDSAFGSSLVYLLLWDDVDGDTASRFGGLCGRSDIGWKCVEDCVSGVSVFAGWVRVTVRVRVQPGVADVDG